MEDSQILGQDRRFCDVRDSEVNALTGEYKLVVPLVDVEYTSSFVKLTLIST